MIMRSISFWLRWSRCCSFCHLPLRSLIDLSSVCLLDDRTELKKVSYSRLRIVQFKDGFRDHQVSFNNETHKNDTELSKHIWQLKSKEQHFKIKWKILTKAKPYSTLTKWCNLCTAEKHFIITKLELATLNKGNELISTWRHRRKFILRYS